MLALVSGDDVLRALAGARGVAFCAYSIRSGAMIAALERAATAGASVRVTLEAAPYRAAALARWNAALAARLRAHGVETVLRAGAHEKSLVVDGAAYYDDCNWLASGADTILRDDDPAAGSVARTKGAALDLELRAIDGARRGDAIDLETESYGSGPVAGALERAARRGARVRVLVSARDLRGNPREAAAIAGLERAGVAVRACDATEKFAIAPGRTWVGSANATFGPREQSDWGALAAGAAIRAHCERAFDARWSSARAV